MVAVRDAAINAFMRPFVVQAVGQAVRSFGDELTRSGADATMSAHPDDYELFELGSFEEDTGRLVPLPEPRSISRGKDFLKE